MKSLSYPVLSSICALIIGILLVAFPELAVVYLVVTIGVLFLLPGLYGLFSYFFQRRKHSMEKKSYFPVLALGSTLLGIWLMVMPEFFVNILMYLLGALLLLGGLNLLAGCWAQREKGRVPVLFYVIAALVVVAGLVVLFNPFEAATVPFIMLGISSIVYSITDLVRLWRYYRLVNKDITDVKIIEEE